MPRLVHALTALLVLVVAGAARAQHHHLTVDTEPTVEGFKIKIVVGYLPAETNFSIADGHIMEDDQIAVVNVLDVFPSGDLAGWYGGFQILLTSDYFFVTGRLDGGNFMWELASVTNVRTGPASAAAWGEFEGGFTVKALSAAATRTGRSYDTFAGAHEHSQGYAFSTPGLYDLTFIVWDSNGVYLDSDPVALRFQVGCLADYNGDGFVDGIDYDTFNNDFEAGHQVADINGDGFVNGIDYDMFNNHFEAGC